MSSFCLVFVILTLFSVGVQSEELFCSRGRNLLLGGIFNYENVLFAYSWKFVDDNNQKLLVWRFEISSSKVVAVGEDTPLNQIFPGIPLFKTGFALTVRCDKSDSKCKSYRQLAFVFFQANYQVYRLANDVFATETDRSRIPWSLSPRGTVANWAFNEPSIQTINAIVLVSGYQSQLFVATDRALFVSAVDINAPKLKWSQIAKNGDFSQFLGGFVVGSEIYFNRNEQPDNSLVKYDTNGKQLETISVWKYFRCDGSTDDRVAERSAIDGGDEAEQDKGEGLATTILIIVGAAILLTNLVAAIFWISVYRKNKSESEN